MDITRELQQLLKLHEQRLQFANFDPQAAWDLAHIIRSLAELRQAGVAIDIKLQGWPLFYHAMPSTTPDNPDWIRRKRNVVNRYFQSSYAVGRKLERQATTPEAKAGLCSQDYAAHGGGFPIRIAGGGCVGAVTVSDLPQREDHVLVTDALAQFLGRDIRNIQLDPTKPV
jgi:uncharacterized protein (UPF0303 family)